MSPKSESRFQAEEVERWITEAHGGSEIALNRLLGLCRPYLLATANKEIGAACGFVFLLLTWCRIPCWKRTMISRVSRASPRELARLATTDPAS